MPLPKNTPPAVAVVPSKKLSSPAVKVAFTPSRVLSSAAEDVTCTPERYNLALLSDPAISRSSLMYTMPLVISTPRGAVVTVEPPMAKL